MTRPALRPAQALERRQRVDRIPSECLGERRLLTAVVGTTLGNCRADTLDELHADPLVAALSQIVDRQIARWFGAPVRAALPLGLGVGAELREEVRQTLG